jgi:hypothetical protein
MDRRRPPPDGADPPPFAQGIAMRLLIETILVALAALAGEPPRFHGAILP